MSRPGTYHFIGPLTESQARRRMRARYSFTEIYEAMDTHCISFAAATRVVKWERDHRFSPMWRLELAGMEA